MSFVSKLFVFVSFKTFNKSFLFTKTISSFELKDLNSNFFSISIKFLKEKQKTSRNTVALTFKRVEGGLREGYPPPSSRRSFFFLRGVFFGRLSSLPLGIPTLSIDHGHVFRLFFNLLMLFPSVCSPICSFQANASQRARDLLEDLG